ncbi:MAG: Eco57I restriction-modification methylase domain-containing protein [Verrucomicrobia bacterium]|nr:Eco57I restriction-modification methylase domain-containing protein [Verrucomicrobiota bacterium]
MRPIDSLEERRLAFQMALDARKTVAERNRRGQFATPAALASEILNYALPLLSGHEEVRFLDPATGTGAFYSALREVFPKQQIGAAIGFEIDPHYGQPASELWRSSGFVIKLADFTRETPSPRFNLVICNPPYVRHHHLTNGDKSRLQMRSYQASGMKLSGLAGLYCHFISLSHAWMADGGIAGWLIPSEFMDVNYGREVKRYLLEKVTLLHIHRFDPNEVQFSDALVSSAVVWFRKSRPPRGHAVAFTFGGTLLHPKLTRQVPASALADEPKWTRFPTAGIREGSADLTLSDFFQIKRGVATGANDYFILDTGEISSRNLPMGAFRPILPSPRYVQDNEIAADANGLPMVERRLFLLDMRLPEEQIRRRFPTLFAYLQDGRSLGVPDRYICRHREPWYAQENRPPAPIVCTYLGRGDAKSGRPFRFILNNSKATVANVYLAMYPKPNLAQAIHRDGSLLRKVWTALNQITPEQLLGEGRVYGGGLHKLEPNELASVDASAISDLLPGVVARATRTQMSLFGDEEHGRAQHASPPDRLAAHR